MEEDRFSLETIIKLLIDFLSNANHNVAWNANNIAYF